MEKDKNKKPLIPVSEEAKKYASEVADEIVEALNRQFKDEKNDQ